MLARLFAAAVFLAPAVALAQTSPYAGQQSREIKALSPEDVDGLLQGKGMGLAKAGELNGYPGPMHTLELAKDLALSDAQVAVLKDIQARMAEAAKRVGTTIVEHEHALDRLFAERRIAPTSLNQATLEIGTLQGQLRAIHLTAHLETRAVLSDEQARRYAALRGYGEPGHQGDHPGGHAGGHKHGG